MCEIKKEPVKDIESAVKSSSSCTSVDSIDSLANNTNDFGLRCTSKGKDDFRLFPEYLLYCEGFHRPKCRGLLHLLCTLLLIAFGYRHFLSIAKNSISCTLCAVLYLSSNVFCYGISSLYHVGRWSPGTEIFLQKLDHCGIAILSTGTMIPVSFLILPYTSGLFLIGLTSIFCMWTCYNIFQCRPSVTRQALTAGIIVLLLPQLYSLFTPLEFTGTLLCILFQVMGVIVFVKEPNSKTCQLLCCCPNYFGYHEVFHGFVVAAGICVYAVNYSIILRTKQGTSSVEESLAFVILSRFCIDPVCCDAWFSCAKDFIVL